MKTYAVILTEEELGDISECIYMACKHCDMSEREIKLESLNDKLRRIRESQDEMMKRVLSTYSVPIKKYSVHINDQFDPSK